MPRFRTLRPRRHSARLRTLPVAILVLAAAFSLPANAGAQAQPPNIVVLFTDDMGYGDLPSYGHPTIRTPNLDRMAQEGIRLTGFHSSWAVCTPARAGLLTGRYAIRMGLTGAIGPGSPLGIPAEEMTLAEALRERGYRTAMIGKWHLGDGPAFNPLEHGFDSWFGVPYSHDYTPPWVADAPTTVPLYRNREVVEQMDDPIPLTGRFTEEAVRFIHESGGRPFFLYLGYTMPHLPLVTSEAFRGHSRGGRYGDVIEELDWGVGEILRALREEGLDVNTIVVFTSDNGPWLNPPARMLQGGVERWDVGSPGPFRGSKATTYEGGTRVPAIVRWPGVVTPGSGSEELMSNLDLFPTLLRAAGGEIPAGLRLDGGDVMPLLRGERSPEEREFFYFSNRALEAVRKGPWKLRVVGDEAPELFHLERDPSERYNVAGAHPDRVAALLARMRAFAAEVGAQVADG